MPGHSSRRKRRRLFVWAAALAGGLFAFGSIFLVAAFAYFSRDLPDPNKITERIVAQSTKIYDRTGETVLYEIHGDQRRTVVQLKDIPKIVQQATIAVEDQNFYQHHGFSVTGFVRAFIVNIVSAGRRRPGGSTITQQFVKNSILTKEKTFTRKFRELVLSFQIERKFTKDQILQLYLNEIPYGSSNYGVQAAAQSYFGKNVGDVTLSEAAILAALPQAPTYYSPYGENVDALFSRQRHVLEQMRELGFITKEQEDAATTEKVTFRSKREDIVAPHFVFFVRQLLTEKYGEALVEQGGLKVTTTLDINHQRAAEEAIAEYGARNAEKYKATNAALVSIDTKTGQILSLVGSRDYFDAEHDGNVNVVLRPRQPGSSFKPIVYTTAFKQGYTPDTVLFDVVTNFDTGSGKPYIPHNYTNQEYGPLTMRRALAGSLNIPAVKTLYLAGLNNVFDVAEAFGYTTFTDRSRYGLSLVLGGAEVRLLDHVGAYAALAREGVRHPTTPILKVEDKNGKTLEQYEKREIRVLDEKIVRQTNSILTDNGARSFIFGSKSPLVLPGRPVAAKTGTTNDFRDGWTLGFTPSLAAGVWVGNNDNTEMKRGADGVVVAAPIWNFYMRKVLTGTPVESFKTPDRNSADKPILRGQFEVVKKVPVDRITGKVIPESCRETYPKQFVVTKDFKEVHDTLFWVDKSDPRGPIPEHPEKDPQFPAWEGAVRAWAAKHKYVDIAKLPQEKCSLRENPSAPAVTITAPIAGASITTTTTTFAATATSDQQIKRLDFFLDDAPIGSSATAPYELSYTNTRFENGPHVLRAIATDALGAAGEASVSVEFALPSSSPTLSIVSPQKNAVIRIADFPLDVQITLFDTDGFDRVELLLDGVVAATTQKPKSGPLAFSLAPVSTGTHTISVHAYGGGGGDVARSLTLKIQE